MTRTRIHITLPTFLLAAVVVAITVFGATRWIVERGVDTLPPLSIDADVAAAAPGALDGAKVYASRVDTTVSIDATVGGRPVNGSGVVVDANGLIVTASHVIKDYERGQLATAVVVRFHSGDEVEAELAAIDQFNDLALLRIDPRQVAKLVAAPLADSDKLVVGAEVVAIGAPFGYDFTPTYGNVSAIHQVVDSRINGSWQIPDAVQFDAAINPGNSGGPLFNARGEVIGISQQIATPNKSSAGISFAVSSNIVARALRQFAATGTIRYAWLGLDTVDLTPQLGRAAQLGVEHGAIVQQATGPGAAAGLSTGAPRVHLGRTVRLGDVIVSLAGRPVRSRDDLIRTAGVIDARSPVKIEFIRGGVRQETTITPTIRVIS